MAKSFKKYIIGFWSLYLLGVVLVFVLFLSIANGKLGEMPTFEELEDPQSLLASEIISRDGVVLGRWFRENRTFVSYDQLPQELVDALIATEDVRFYNHSGIDLRGLFRVVKGLATGNSSSGGGSTISQQLAKMLFPRDPLESKLDLVLRKFKEWVIAVKLERSYTKEEIITMYLNKYDFLNLAVGIKSAARIYFNTEPDSLKLNQSAMLVGMAKNSSLYNPIRRPEITQERRNVVLSQMKKYGYINEQVYDSVAALPLDIDFQREDFKSGSAPYLREFLRTTLGATKPDRSEYASWQQQQFEEDSVLWETTAWYGWCSKNFKQDGTNYDLYKDGLRIITTIDSRMQQYAEEAVEEHLKTDLQPNFSNQIKNFKNPPFSDDLSEEQISSDIDLCIRQSERYRVLRLQGLSSDEIKKNFQEPVEMTVFSWEGEKDTIMSPQDSILYYLSYLRSSFMAMDIKSGQVRAYVGGPNYKYFMYDMVTTGKRQVGSTVKPFLYTLAMQNGLSPCLKVPNVPQQFVLPDGTTWQPKNSDAGEEDGKMVTLEWGLANSVNNISAWLMKQFNPQSVVEVMRKMGVYSPIDPVPSLFLGTSEITLYEMVGAFGTFGNKGVYTQPYFITRIEDKYGNVIATFSPERHDAVDEQTAYLMTYLLQNVVDQGTGNRLRWHEDYGQFEGPIAGKTGTTQDQADGWFMGFTPQLVAGAWTGADLLHIHFPLLRDGQGANMALPIWGRFMKKVYADKTLEYNEDAEFEKPMNFTIDLNCDDEEDFQQSSGNDSFF